MAKIAQRLQINHHKYTRTVNVQYTRQCSRKISHVAANMRFSSADFQDISSTVSHYSKWKNYNLYEFAIFFISSTVLAASNAWSPLVFALRLCSISTSLVNCKRDRYDKNKRNYFSLLPKKLLESIIAERTTDNLFFF